MSDTNPPTPVVAADQINSAIRTAVGVAVGTAVAVAAKHGLHIDKAAADAWLLPLCIGAYNGIVRVAEHRWPQLGWLLGAPRK